MEDRPPRVDSVRVSDEALVERARASDEEAFAALVGRYQDRIYRLALRLTGNSSDAEDVMQNTFLQMFRKLGSFRGEAGFGTWLYKIATNNALMHRRSVQRRPSESLESFLPQFDESGVLARTDVDYGLAARADTILERKNLLQKALRGIERLEEIYRAPFVLHDLEESSMEETARILGISTDLVRQRLHRARLMLRGYLGQLVGEP